MTEPHDGTWLEAAVAAADHAFTQLLLDPEQAADVDVHAMRRIVASKEELEPMVELLRAGATSHTLYTRFMERIAHLLVCATDEDSSAVMQNRIELLLGGVLQLLPNGDMADDRLAPEALHTWHAQLTHQYAQVTATLAVVDALYDQACQDAPSSSAFQRIAQGAPAAIEPALLRWIAHLQTTLPSSWHVPIGADRDRLQGTRDVVDVVLRALDLCSTPAWVPPTLVYQVLRVVAQHQHADLVTRAGTTPQRATAAIAALARVRQALDALPLDTVPFSSTKP